MLDMEVQAETGAVELSEIVFAQLKQDTVQGNPASLPKIPVNFEGQASCVPVSYCSNHICVKCQKKKGSVHKYMQRENEQRVIDHFSNLKLKDNKDEEINHLE